MKLPNFIVEHKINFVLVGVLLLLLIGGFLGYQKFFADRNLILLSEIDLTFDPEGPYALLFPRRDGNALVLNLKRTSSYDSISYELAYNAEGIDRGVVGDIKTNEKKGEYEQEVLFGTCSKNVCKYDKGVENGTLTLHIKKGRQPYRMITQWHLQKPAISLGNLTSGDEHFSYSMVGAKREDLTLVGYSIVNDLTGVPKLPDGKDIFGKVYALNVPLAKELMAGQVSVELANNPPSDTKLFRYSDKKGWEELETKVNGSNLSAKASGAGIFAVLASKK